MGKPFASELLSMSSTIDWGNSINLQPLRDFVHSSDSPVYLVGSGGSLSACQYGAMLLEDLGVIAKAITPLEIYGLSSVMRTSRVILVSSSGKNNDILNAAKVIRDFEPKAVASVTMRTNTKLSEFCDGLSGGQMFEFELPSGKDGFLATNSLLAYFIVFYRTIVSNPEPFDTMPELSVKEREGLSKVAQYIKEDSTAHVLHGWRTKAVAMDIESKSSESALINILLSDYRNFGHGRHHWFAKRQSSSLIISLQTNSDVRLASKTLNAMPHDTAIICLATDYSDGRASIELLLKSFILIEAIGKIRNIDPGRPGVPEFGRIMYNLRYSSLLTPTKSNLFEDKRMEKSILLKVKATSVEQLSFEEVDFWKNAHHAFVERLNKARFGTIIFDFDGTLCSNSNRFDGLSEEISLHLNKILKKGFIIAIATGRGKSALKDLKEAIDPIYWENVIIAYYNGGIIGKLEDKELTLSKEEEPEITQIVEILNEYSLRFNWTVSRRPSQVTIEFNSFATGKYSKELIRHLYITHGFESTGIQVLESSHSVDIISSKSSKVNLFENCKKLALQNGKSEEFLCIGDKGSWPGNDFQLLNHNLSLSVDEVSTSEYSCWNLSSPGNKNLTATFEYLKNISFGDKSMKIKL